MKPRIDATMGADDIRAARALAAWHGPFDAVTANSIQTCARCREYALVGHDGFCLPCRDDHRWSRFNRAMCNLVHRGVPAAPG